MVGFCFLVFISGVLKGCGVIYFLDVIKIFFFYKNKIFVFIFGCGSFLRRIVRVFGVRFRVCCGGLFIDFLRSFRGDGRIGGWLGEKGFSYWNILG